MKTYIEDWLPYLVHYGVDDLVPGFHDNIHMFADKTENVIGILKDQYNEAPARLKDWLNDSELTGNALNLKDHSSRAHINSFRKSAKRPIGCCCTRFNHNLLFFVAHWLPTILLIPY